jgi:uroporphyrinogen-III synthase
MPLRVLITRAAEDAASLVDPLRAAGAEPLCVPLLERRTVPGAVYAALLESPATDLAMLTSAAAAAALEDAVRAGAACPARIAAVGPTTARRASRLAGALLPLPARATALDLVASLGDLSGVAVIYPRAEIATPGIAAALREAGAVLREVVAYRNVEPAGASAALAGAWPFDVATALSSSAARRLAQALQAAELAPAPAVIAIGPSTAEAARSVGLQVAAVADPHTAAGVVAAVLTWAARRGGATARRG